MGLEAVRELLGPALQNHNEDQTHGHITDLEPRKFSTPSSRLSSTLGTPKTQCLLQKELH